MPISNLPARVPTRGGRRGRSRGSPSQAGAAVVCVRATPTRRLEVPVSRWPRCTPVRDAAVAEGLEHDVEGHTAPGSAPCARYGDQEWPPDEGRELHHRGQRTDGRCNCAQVVVGAVERGARRTASGATTVSTRKPTTAARARCRPRGTGEGPVGKAVQDVGLVELRRERCEGGVGPDEADLRSRLAMHAEVCC
jgi:hypothetical protein